MTCSTFVPPDKGLSLCNSGMSIKRAFSDRKPPHMMI